MPRAKPKTQELINYLGSCVKHNVKLSPFEIRRFHKEALQLPTQHDRDIALGFLSVNERDQEKAIAYFKNALSSSLSNANDVVYLGVTYNVFSQISKFKETLLEGLKKYPNSVQINEYLQLVSIQFLDMENFRKATETLDKLKKCNNNNEEHSIFYQWLSSIQEQREELRITAVGSEIVKLIEDYSLTMMNQRILKLPEMGHYSFIYQVTSDDNSLTSFDLNWEFSGRIVDADLLDVPATIQFQKMNIEDFSELRSEANAS